MHQWDCFFAALGNPGSASEDIETLNIGTLQH